MDEKELEAREREITARETRVKALERLSQKGLSAGLIGILNFESEEKCMASIDAVEEAFREEVRRQVDRRLTDNRRIIPGSAAKDEDEMTDREYYNYKLGRK